MANTWTTTRSLQSGFKRSGADLVTTMTSFKDMQYRWVVELDSHSINPGQRFFSGTLTEPTVSVKIVGTLCCIVALPMLVCKIR